MESKDTSLSTTAIPKDSSLDADFTGFVTAAMSPSGALWRRWFERVGEHSIVNVVNATATLVIEECNIAREAERERCAKIAFERGQEYLKGIGPELSDECKRELRWQAIASNDIRDRINHWGAYATTHREGGLESTTEEKHGAVSALPELPESSSANSASEKTEQSIYESKSYFDLNQIAGRRGYSIARLPAVQTPGARQELIDWLTAYDERLLVPSSTEGVPKNPIMHFCSVKINGAPWCLSSEQRQALAELPPATMDINAVTCEACLRVCRQRQKINEETEWLK